MRAVLLSILGLILISAGVLWEGETKLKPKHRKTFEMAEFHFGAEDFIESEKQYRILVEHYPMDGYFHFKLGYSLFELKRLEESIHHFQKALQHDLQEAHFYLARANHRIENFEEAEKHYKIYGNFSEKLKTDATVKAHLKAVQRAKEAYSNPVEVRISNAGQAINSTFEDYVPLISADGDQLVFTSKRPDQTWKKDKFSDELFEDIFVATKVNGNWESAVQLAAPVNSPYHDANVCFSADGKSLILYRNDKHRGNGDLFLAEYVNGLWGEPVKLPESINSKYHEPSAALSPNGDRMYLVSDRPGSLGDRDIFLLNKLPNGEWSKPINLGKTVNTKFNEDAPFVEPNGNYLYFASEGHNSIGGFDIFRSKILSDGTLGTPENMGYPINSVQDDIYFSITKDGKKAYYSSLKIKDTNGEQDIYEIDFLFEKQDHVVVKGKVLNAKNDPVEARVELKDEKGKLIQTINAAPETGNFLLSVIPDRKYKITAHHDGYEFHEEWIEPKIARKGEFSILKLNIILKEKRHE
ncbi:MAG: tetratricopeptide repeat protein [Bacteroidota bacterium]